jgi:hypothetical protein
MGFGVKSLGRNRSVHFVQVYGFEVYGFDQRRSRSIGMGTT